MPRSYAIEVLLVCAVGSTACSDDSAADNAGSSSSSSTTPSDTSSPAQDTSTGSSADTSTADTADESSTGTPAGVEVEVVTYATQPMVVDLTLTLTAPGTATLEHTTDAGVVVAPLDGGDATHLRYRVRGLAPGTTHTMQYVVTDDAGVKFDGTTDFDTLAALPAFVGAFPIETTDVEPAPLYRLADWNPFPVGDFAGAIMIDPTGITRWYLSAFSDVPGPPGVWVGIKLRDDGTIVHLVNDTFMIRDELGTIVTEIPAVDLGQPTLHHDVHELPNGNFMAIGQSFREVEYDDLGTIWVVGDTLVEFTLDGEVLWTWDSFDHLDPQRRRANFADPIIDPTTDISASDWTHANGFIFDEAQDTITLSLRHQDWIIQIDHGTGEVIWRLGDEGDFTLADGDQWFFHQHSPDWQPDGSLLLFDNANGNPEIPDVEAQSRAMRLELDYDAMTAAVVWEDDEAQLQVPFAGDADRIEGGHYLVTDSSVFGPNGMYTRIRELEVDHDPERIWSIETPVNHWVYRTTAQSRLVGQPAR